MTPPLRARVLRRLGHACRPPEHSMSSRWNCRCGQRWVAVFVPLHGYRWMRAELEGDPR